MAKIITKNQFKILEKISGDNFLTRNFYLTGGTALAEFYLKHRLSEDLDFFSEQEFEPTAIAVFFQKNKTDLKIKKIDFEQSYNRNLFFLHVEKEIIKTEFTYFPFPRIEQLKKFKNISIDSAYDIAVNKIFTIYQKERARDYIDLYFLIKKYKWSIEELVKKAKIKFDWHIDYLQLGTQFTKAENVSDYPKMIKTIPEKKWISFFIKEAGKFKEKIIKQ